MEFKLIIDWQALTIASFIAIIVERLVESLVAPLLDWVNSLGIVQIPKLTLLYVAGIAGFLVIWISKINLFALIPEIDYQIGLILSGLLVGGGSSLLHDIFSLVKRTNR